jgi:tetratricopeptide (TPR) repeat protein
MYTFREKNMTSLRANSALSLGAILLAAAFLSPRITPAQGAAGPTTNTLMQSNADQANYDFNEKSLQQNLGDPKEDAAYRAFHKVAMQDADKKIKLGQAFLNKYPSDRYAQAVYDELVRTYYAKQDLTDFYACSDKALSVFPDDVSLLALTGWVIPRIYKSDDPDGDKKLDKAEADEKHAIQLIDTVPKPSAMSDGAFAEYKAEEFSIAHNALGLIYFRRERYDDSAKEMQQFVAGEANPDPTDLLVLGADFENLGRFKEAVDAFNRCAQVPGGFQATCKQQAANSLKLAADAK